MTLTRKLVVDEKGSPMEVIIPYEQFVEIVEKLGLDLDVAEQRELREALDDSNHGRRNSFIPADKV